MNAGASKVDITPPVGVELAGYAARVQPSVDVHDRLWLRLLLLEDRGKRLAWFNADLIGFSDELVQRIRTALKEKFDLDGDEVVLSATHTHAGPPTVDLLGCGKLHDRSYLDRIVLAAVEATETALGSLVEATVSEGTSTCEIALDRRHRERGMRRDEVVVLDIRSATGEPIALWANYAVHPVCLNHQNRRISGDIHGAAARALESVYPVALVTNGACGDLNPPVQGGDAGAMEGFGRTLADAILAAVHQSHEVSSAFHARCADQRIPVEPMDTDTIRERAARVREEQAGRDPVWATSSRYAADEWERRMLARLPLIDTVLPVHEVEIGGRRFVGMGAEVLSQMTADLRDAWGPRTTVVGYTDGNIGYLCPESAFDEGGYEPDLAFIYYGQPKIARGAFEGVATALAERSSPK